MRSGCKWSELARALVLRLALPRLPGSWVRVTLPPQVALPPQELPLALPVRLAGSPEPPQLEPVQSVPRLALPLPERLQPERLQPEQLQPEQLQPEQLQPEPPQLAEAQWDLALRSAQSPRPF